MYTLEFLDCIAYTTNLRSDLIIDVANWLYKYPYIIAAELIKRIRALRAPQL